MKQIRNYFKNWDVSRIIRLTLGGALVISYYYNQESLFLMMGAMLSIQAVFNMSCAGGSCGVNNTTTKSSAIKIEKYEPKN